jgi:DNA-binding CsgD family transcriptional regulator
LSFAKAGSLCPDLRAVQEFELEKYTGRCGADVEHSVDLIRPVCRGVQASMKRHAQGESDSEAGLLLLDFGNLPVYANTEAIRILLYPQDAEKVQSLACYLAEKIRSVIVNGRSPTCLPQARELVSGRRRYVCRIFDLASGWKHSSTPAVAVLIERAHQVSFQVSLIAERFQLTRREEETVSLLLGGLTSKEIAQRMQISPNTVKAFLRLVMIKMGVSSRPGIMGKIFKTQIAFCFFYVAQTPSAGLLFD